MAQALNRILDLNTDCLIEIFKYLSIEDVCEVKKIHPKFDDALDHVVSKSNFVVPLIKCDEDDSESFLFKIDLMRTFLSFFGKKIKYFNFRLHSYSMTAAYVISSRLMEIFIYNYCINGDMKVCHFNGLIFDKEFFASIKHFIESLEEIRVDVKYLDDFIWILDFLISLKIKRIQIEPNYWFEIDPCVLFMKIAKSELEAVEFSSILLGISGPADIPINYTLKKLFLGHNVSFNLNYLKSFPNIENLRIQNRECYSWDPILELVKLKNLVVTYANESRDFRRFLAFLKNLAKENRLEVLEIADYQIHYSSDEGSDDGDVMRMDEDDANVEGTRSIRSLSKVVSQMTNLKELTIFHGVNLKLIGLKLVNLRVFVINWYPDNMNDAKLLEFLGYAKELVKLVLRPANGVNQGFYDAVVRIRKNQQNQKLLRIHTNGIQEITCSDEQKRYVLLKEIQRYFYLN